MEKKNTKLTIIVAILLLTVGVSFAYFTAKTIFEGTGARVAITTAEIKGATLNVEGELNFDKSNIYPGHESLSIIKLTATGNNELIPYNLIWNGTNSISTLNYKVYKTTTKINVETNCETKMTVMDGAQVYGEICSFTNIESLGNVISSGTITKGDTKVNLVNDEFITATSGGNIVYYYIILEFPNLDDIQNADMNGRFNGSLTVEESDTAADVNIVAINVKQEDGTYKEEKDVPQEGYVLNSENSTCSNSATPEWDNENHRFYINNLTKSGTDCNLFFDKKPTSEDTLAKLNITKYETNAPDFTQVATTNDGVYRTLDEMYGGNTYYWRGATTNNYVSFAGFCWRIVRINGDGSIRLIYDGTKCHANETNTSESIALKSAYNSNYDNSSYVGWSYTAGSQRPNDTSPQVSGTRATIRVTLEDTWYKTNIMDKGHDGKIATGKFCNDRNTKDNATWVQNGSTTQYYKAYQRLFEGSKTPTTSCPDGDVYEVKVGLITADEVQFAGASASASNTSYYLYNGQYYWTMSPDNWDGRSGRSYAVVFYVGTNGSFGWNNVDNTSRGVRPVINLNADTQFQKGGNGTIDTPFVVA